MRVIRCRIPFMKNLCTAAACRYRYRYWHDRIDTGTGTSQPLSASLWAEGQQVIHTSRPRSLKLRDQFHGTERTRAKHTLSSRPLPTGRYQHQPGTGIQHTPLTEKFFEQLRYIFQPPTPRAHTHQMTSILIKNLFRY